MYWILDEIFLEKHCLLLLNNNNIVVQKRNTDTRSTMNKIIYSLFSEVKENVELRRVLLRRLVY